MSDIVWTNHAKDRNKDRQISQNWVEQTINSPDRTKELEEGKTESKKKFGYHTVTVISTKSKEGKYLVLSAWINPPTIGTNEYKARKHNAEMKKSGYFRKFWLTFIHQIGL